MPDKIRQNRALFAMIVIEIFFLLIMGGSALTREKFSRSYSVGEISFQYDSMELVSQNEDGSYTIASDNWAEEADAWRLDGLTLNTGRYRVIVSYEAEGILEKDNQVVIRSTETRNYYSSEILNLRNEASFVEKEIAVPRRTNDIVIAVHYGGLGRMSIKSIRIVENTVARLGRWLQFLALFLIVDMLYAVFFGRELINAAPEKKRHIFAFLCITLFSSLPMLTDFCNTGHDLYYHVGRIQGIAQELKNGQFPVRIYTSAYNGYGYASSLFYGELLLYLPALLYLLGLPLFRAYQVFVVLVNLGTCLISYYCISRMFRSRNAGVTGAFLYTCAAYRITNIYIRTAVGEYTAMMFLPLLCYALWIMVSQNSMKKERRCAFLWLALGITGLLQTHLLSLEMALVFLVIFGILSYRKIFAVHNLITIGKAVGVVVLWNLWFLVPFIQSMLGDYNVNGDGIDRIEGAALYLPQLFGVFFSHNGKNTDNGLVGEMPLTLGFALTLGLLGLILYRVRNGERQDREWKIGRTAALLGVFALWMTSIYCPWQNLQLINKTLAKYLYMVQFPWRYLAVATVLIVLAAVSYTVLTEKNMAGWRGGSVRAA